MSEYDWIEKLEKQPNYKLGQNFLIDTNISRKITKLVQGQLADPIIEVGPGTGSLTNELLKDNYRIKAVEIDSDASELLKLRFQDVPNLEIFNEDAMTFDYSNQEILAKFPSTIKIELAKETKLYFDLTQISLFDAQTEERI